MQVSDTLVARLLSEYDRLKEVPHEEKLNSTILQLCKRCKIYACSRSRSKDIQERYDAALNMLEQRKRERSEVVYMIDVEAAETALKAAEESYREASERLDKHKEKMAKFGLNDPTDWDLLMRGVKGRPIPEEHFKRKKDLVEGMFRTVDEIKLEYNAEVRRQGADTYNILQDLAKQLMMEENGLREDLLWLAAEYDGTGLPYKNCCMELPRNLSEHTKRIVTAMGRLGDE